MPARVSNHLRTTIDVNRLSGLRMNNTDRVNFIFIELVRMDNITSPLNEKKRKIKTFRQLSFKAHVIGNPGIEPMTSCLAVASVGDDMRSPPLFFIKCCSPFKGCLEDFAISDKNAIVIIELCVQIFRPDL